MRRDERIASHLDPTLILTKRRVQILELLGTGARGPDVAKALGIGLDTVYEHLKVMRDRFGARSTPELLRLAIHHGFLSP